MQPIPATTDPKEYAWPADWTREYSILEPPCICERGWLPLPDGTWTDCYLCNETTLQNSSSVVS